MSKKRNELYTKEYLLKVMVEQYKKKPSSTCMDFREKFGLPNQSVYRDVFGSFAKALELSGVKHIKERKRHNLVKEEDLKNDLLRIIKLIDKTPGATEYDKYSKYCTNLIRSKYKTYNDFLDKMNVYSTKEGKSVRIKDDFLLNELKRFVKEFNKVPVQSDFENLKNYPSRKTFANHFGSFNNALKLAGLEPTTKSIEDYKRFNESAETKSMLIKWIQNKADELGRTPTCKDIEKEEFNRGTFRRIFGTYNKALIEAGLSLNNVGKYDDEFLHSEFERFIKENGRPPYLHEFNNSEYPSFWCYQNRFGSWNNTFIAYGYEPNDSNRKYILDDGEICASSYEFDISKWLKENNIKYERNIKYIDICNSYKGKMDCDYKIYFNGKVWYVEMAGMLPRKGTPFEKWSYDERIYFFKIKYKKKLLNKVNANYLIIPPSHMKTKSLEEIFKPIFMKKE